MVMGCFTIGYVTTALFFRLTSSSFSSGISIASDIDEYTVNDEE